VGSDLEQEYVEYVRARLARLHRMAYLLCGDASRADDIVQSALTTLYVRWRHIRGADSIDAYVHTMVVRTFLGEKRRAWDRVRLVPATPDRPESSMEPGVLERLHVQAALRRLSPRQQAVLVLRFMLDMSVADVAKVLGCAEGTVKSQTANGLVALRKVLAQDNALQLRHGSSA
jgi:RNA polymerase sigma-70 factor (sigma-E family)